MVTRTNEEFPTENLAKKIIRVVTEKKCWIPSWFENTSNIWIFWAVGVLMQRSKVVALKLNLPPQVSGARWKSLWKLSNQKFLKHIRLINKRSFGFFGLSGFRCRDQKELNLNRILFLMCKVMFWIFGVRNEVCREEKNEFQCGRRTKIELLRLFRPIVLRWQERNIQLVVLNFFSKRIFCHRFPPKKSNCC